MNFLELSQLAVMCQAELWEDGLTVRQETDFSVIGSIAQSLDPKKTVTPVLEPGLNDFTSSNCFWLIAEKDGQPMLMGGARFDDLTQTRTTDFLKASLDRVYGGDEVSNFSPLIDQQIGGRVVYFGDLHTNHRSPFSKRARLRLRLFTCIAHAAAVSDFKPDVIYSFIREDDVQRGAAENYGFTRRIPNPLTWRTEPLTRKNSEWIVYRPKAENDEYFSRCWDLTKLELPRSK